MTADRLVRPHVTTRRAFVAAAGFGGVGLYGLWAAYGAAPGPLALLGLDGPAHGHEASGPQAGTADPGHGGHGGATDLDVGSRSDEFRRMTDTFIERHRLPDGTVYPRRAATPAAAGYVAHDAHAAHGEPPAPAAIDVPMVAGRWYYLPATLRLDAGQPYRLRMMALDMSHGASIQFGRGARMVRLRPGRETQLELTFDRPGRYFMYCTVYCGAAHDRMQAAIEVI